MSSLKWYVLRTIASFFKELKILRGKDRKMCKHAENKLNKSKGIWISSSTRHRNN
jgi:hypothetical protein